MFFLLSFSVTSAPLTAAQLKSPPLSQHAPLATMNTNAPVSSLLVKDGIFTFAKPTTATSTIVQPQKVTTVTAAAPTSMAFPYYLGSLPKFAHPVLVTSLMAPAVGLQASSAASSPLSLTLPNTLPATANLPNIPSLVTLKTERSATDASQQFVIQNNTGLKTQSNIATLTLASSAVKTVPSINSIAAMTGASTVPVRQVFAPGLLPGQLAWPLLTYPRSPLIVPTTSMPSSQAALTGSTVASSAGQVTNHPLVSLANLNQLTQMMTPMTVMSPGIQMTPTALTQSQLNSLTQSQLNGVFGNPLLKQLQLPLGIQTVIGQQMVKPVVVVTVPNIVTTTPASLPSNTALVTSSL